MTTRIDLVDIARGLALIAMTLFHFGWDLEAFRFFEAGFSQQPFMVWFARGIASSFLILVGVSLVLAHQNEFNLRKFAIRFLQIAGSAALISIATYIATPSGFIFFGILHHIAAASLLGLLFLKFNWWLNLIAAILVFSAGFWARTQILDAPIWWWSGLSQITPKSNDYVPIVPFFAAVLIGIALAKYGLDKQWDNKLAGFNGKTFIFSKLLGFLGRNSLIYYLVHQPILIGALYLLTLAL